MPATNLFTTAKVVAKSAAAKKADTAKTEIEGLEIVGAIDHTIKWLTAVLESAKATVWDSASPKFIADGIKAEKQPENFNGFEGKTTANLQLRKRASSSGFNDIELELVNEHKVPTTTSGGLMFVNPERMEWLMKNSAKISAAIAKIPDAPVDLFQVQPTKTVASDATIDYVFRAFKKDPATIAKLLPIVSTFAIKPKFDTADEEANDKALAVINKFLSEETSD